MLNVDLLAVMMSCSVLRRVVCIFLVSLRCNESAGEAAAAVIIVK